MKRVKIIKTPPEHGTGKGSGKCTCKNKTGTLENTHTDGIAIVRLDKGGHVGLPFGCLKEL